jgi:hypothetical protein
MSSEQKYVYVVCLYVNSLITVNGPVFTNSKSALEWSKFQNDDMLKREITTTIWNVTKRAIDPPTDNKNSCIFPSGNPYIFVTEETEIVKDKTAESQPKVEIQNKPETEIKKNKVEIQNKPETEINKVEIQNKSETEIKKDKVEKSLSTLEIDNRKTFS